MTVVEVVVAGLILIVGALGVLAIVDSATRNTYRAEQSQVVANVLQREMEKIRQVPYSELALTELPTSSSDPASPDSRLASTNFYTARDGTAPMPLVYNGASDGAGTVAGGTVDPGPVPFEVGDVSGEIYRYVVWDDCPTTLCEDGNHLKRAVVAVALDDSGAGGAARRYQEVQGQVVDPEVEPSDNPGPPPGGGSQAWTLWLTDTTCDNGSRQPLAGNHQAHNTRGTCSAGLKTKANCKTLLVLTECPGGAPDLMVESAAPDEAEPLYDYATDIEPVANADKDIGLTLPKSSGGCNLVSSLLGTLPIVPDVLDPYMFQRAHKWVSPPIPGGISLELLGKGTLSLWTRSINGAIHSGKLCATIFTRELSVDLLGKPVILDTPAVNLDLTDGLLNLNYFTHSLPQWPHAGWTEISIPLNFTLKTGLLPGRRLGVALWVAGSGTSGDGLEFMYDQRSFDSRLELEVGPTISLPIFG